MAKFRKVAVVAKEGHKGAKFVASRVVKALTSSGLQVLAVSSSWKGAEKVIPSLERLKGEKPDLVISVGGDGTILKTLRKLEDEVPILGVNVGGRGVLAEVLPSEITSAVKKVMDGAYFFERRLRLVASISSRAFPPALNEVYLNRIPQTATPTYMIRVGHGVQLRQRMDGVMVSTPTGSTGHSFSVGGPVVSESLNTFLLTPIGSLLRLPPIVLPAEPFKISSNEPTNLVVDGQEAYSLKANTSVTISRYKRDAVFLRFDRRYLRQLINLGFG